MKTFVSIFFYSSLLWSDPGEESQDGSCHPGVGKQRLSDFRQDPSWAALCLAWPSRRDTLEKSLQGGVRGAQTQRESRESRRSWSEISHTFRQVQVNLNSSLSFLEMWHKIKPKVCFTHTCLQHLTKLTLWFHTLMFLCSHFSSRHNLK